MFGIPTNVFPLFIFGVVASFFAVRAFWHYRDVKTPINFYFSMSALLFGTSCLFYSVPFALTNVSSTLKLTVTIADLLFYAAILVQMRIIWYIALQDRVKFVWLLLPTLVIAIVSFVSDMQLRLTSTYYSTESFAHFPTSQLSLWLLAFLSISIILVGILMIAQVRSVKKAPQRLRLISIGAMYLLAGLTAEYNFLFLQGNNTSSYILVGYLLAVIGFIVGLFIILRSNK